MNLPLNDLTVVSITYNNPGIHNTIRSLKPLMRAGAKVQVQNGGEPLLIRNENLSICEENDLGIYDGLNKGIQKVNTPFFMLLHAGDEFIGSPESLAKILSDLKHQKKDLSLNSCFIGSRKLSSRLWRPWMLHFGAQPPHLPCIYRTTVFKPRPYRLDIPIIADFDYFKSYSWKSYIKHNLVLVQMETGGATSGGFLSFISVSQLMLQHYGFRGLVMVICRVPIKVIQMIH